MSADLKECPFCGCMPDVQEIEAHKHNMKLGDFTMPDHPGCFTLECPTPGCCAMIADTKAELITAWERRAIAPPVAAGSVDKGKIGDLLVALSSSAVDVSRGGNSCIHRAAALELLNAIDAWGAQQREAGRLEGKASNETLLRASVNEMDAMERERDEARQRAEKAEAARDWNLQEALNWQEKCEIAEADASLLRNERDNLQKLATSRREWAEKAEAELAEARAEIEVRKTSVSFHAARVKELEADRQALQAEGKHPAPCARNCEANAFQIEVRRLEAESAHKQSIIDRLMLEYCPDEMTPQQVKEWGEHQVRAPAGIVGSGPNAKEGSRPCWTPDCGTF